MEELFLLEMDFKNIWGKDSQFCLYLLKCPQIKSSNHTIPNQCSIYSKPKDLEVACLTGLETLSLTQFNLKPCLQYAFLAAMTYETVLRLSWKLSAFCFICN